MAESALENGHVFQRESAESSPPPSLSRILVLFANNGLWETNTNGKKRNEARRGETSDDSQTILFSPLFFRCCREQRAMAEEREARGAGHRGATAVRAEITPVRGASQHQMVSRRDPYLHIQRGRRIDAGEQRHSREVTCARTIFHIARLCRG